MKINKYRDYDTQETSIERVSHNTDNIIYLKDHLDDAVDVELGDVNEKLAKQDKTIADNLGFVNETIKNQNKVIEDNLGYVNETIENQNKTINEYTDEIDLKVYGVEGANKLNGGYFQAHEDKSIIPTDVWISNNGESDLLSDILPLKQDKLIAGNNIKIENNIISSTSSGGNSEWEKILNNHLFQGSYFAQNHNVKDLTKYMTKGSAYEYNIYGGYGDHDEKLFSLDFVKNSFNIVDEWKQTIILFTQDPNIPTLTLSVIVGYGDCGNVPYSKRYGLWVAAVRSDGKLYDPVDDINEYPNVAKLLDPVITIERRLIGDEI